MINKQANVGFQNKHLGNSRKLGQLFHLVERITLKFKFNKSFQKLTITSMEQESGSSVLIEIQGIPGIGSMGSPPAKVATPEPEGDGDMELDDSDNTNE